MEDPRTSLASLSLTHVHYDPSDPVSYVSAWLALVPQGLCIMYVTLLWASREVEIAMMFAGQMGCEALNFGLKRLIREERPKRKSTFSVAAIESWWKRGWWKESDEEQIRLQLGENMVKQSQDRFDVKSTQVLTLCPSSAGVPQIRTSWWRGGNLPALFSSSTFRLSACSDVAFRNVR